MTCTRELCKQCGKPVSVGFSVPNDIWLEVVGEQYKNDVKCLACFTLLADEKFIEWDKNIKFYPISFNTHMQFPKQYIRFGDIPENEISHIYRSDEGNIGYENGVSVYDCVIDENNNYRIVMPTSVFNDSYGMGVCVTLSGCIQKDKIYIVTGDEVGLGSDGEPLLKNITIIKQLK